MQVNADWVTRIIMRSTNTAIPANIYMFKVNDRNTVKRCEICPKLTDAGLMSLVLTLNIFHTFFLGFLLLTLNR